MTESLAHAPLQWMSRLSTSRFNNYAGLTSDTLVALGLLAAGFRFNDRSAVWVLGLMLCGLLAFSLLEYVVHRWLFHGPFEVFEQGHRRHHEQPRGYDALPFFLPPLAYLLLAALLACVMPASSALLIGGSVAAGYAAYGLSHWSMHAFRFRHPLARAWAAAHHIHHNHPERNFGVTSPLWDAVLRTQYVSASRRQQRAR
ncbi:MAG: sterol desaturase family protein [Proteobacteria bacterium]|nr:sterol desaturase family protein [Pseudomonadota bacterium]